MLITGFPPPQRCGRRVDTAPPSLCQLRGKPAEAAGTAGSRFNNNGDAVRAGLQLIHGGFTLYAGASAGLYSAAEKYGVMGGVIYAFEVERLVGLFK